MHQLWRKDANGLWNECKDRGCSVTPMGWESKQEEAWKLGQGGVVYTLTS